jgi:hypothetical protein
VTEETRSCSLFRLRDGLKRGADRVRRHEPRRRSRFVRGRLSVSVPLPGRRRLAGELFGRFFSDQSLCDIKFFVQAIAYRPPDRAVDVRPSLDAGGSASHAATRSRHDAP